MSVLHDITIRQALRKAWEESRPGTVDAHEEGGFILRGADGTLAVERWPYGVRDQIVVPPHTGGSRDNRRILATFHTHPNPGLDYQQEPGLTDVRAVREDHDLHHPDYEGEYIISTQLIYRVLQSGSVEQLGRTKELLEMS